ncbi:MAG TPA: hypothetical protein VJX30_06490 [Terriglobales bacterium]|jgi:hypothetical protein|nr:hypothetical protein [Terriglobales bacterium]
MPLLGPQGEPLLTDAELRDVSCDGPGFGPTKVPNSSVASGTDRDIVNTETAVLVGPQGEKIYPLDGICPVCGHAQFPEEVCSQPGEDLDAQPGATPDFAAIREDDDTVEIDEPESDEAFEDGASPDEFELLS